MLLRIILSFFAIIIAVVALHFITWPLSPYRTASLEKNEIPHFKEVEIDFVHQYDGSKSLPFIGASVFDLKGNGEQHLFVGGGYNQPDHLYVFREGKFIDITAESGLTKEADDTTYGSAAIDVNNDGIVDLFVTRESGVYLYTYSNGKYNGKKLNIPLDPKSAPVSIAVADLKKRGKVDLFICCYIKLAHVEGQTIFNKEGYGGKSLLLLNNGDNTFTDITKQAGLDYVHNTFQAAFVDLNDNGDLDLVVAYDTGQARTYKNMGNLTFKNMPNPNSDLYGYPMGVAVGDYSGKGRPDLFFSNIGPFKLKALGSSPPESAVRGDLREDQKLLREYALLQNEGDFVFKDVADQAKVADYGFGWGPVFQDFNNNGRLDLAIAQNYIAFPVHKFLKLPCRLLIQAKDKTFVPVEKAAGVNNPYYALSPIVADFNGNGYSDLAYTNLTGKLRVFLNKGGSNHYLKVELKNEPKSLGATVTLEKENGDVITRFFVPTQGICSYQTNTLFFGLGKEESIKKVTVKFTDGTTKNFDSPKANTTLKVG